MSLHDLIAVDGKPVAAPVDESGNPVLQVERLDRLIKYLEGHPEDHDQDEWVKQETECGTVMCAAGHAAVTFSGLRLRTLRDAYNRLNYLHATTLSVAPVYRDVVEAYAGPDGGARDTYEDAFLASRFMVTDGTKTYTIPWVARQYLGLTDLESRMLFLKANDLHELKEEASNIKHGVYRRDQEV